MALVTTSAQA